MFCCQLIRTICIVLTISVISVTAPGSSDRESDPVADPDVPTNNVPEDTRPLEAFLERVPGMDYDRIYKLEIDDTLERWLQRGRDFRMSPEASEYPTSRLFNAQVHYRYDTVPDRTDESGQTFLVTMFQSLFIGESPYPGMPTAMAEGPFRIQPLHPFHRIQLSTQPDFLMDMRWYNRFLRRPTQSFQVVHPGQMTYWLPTGMHGRQWLTDPTMIRPVSEILSSGEEWLIDARPDPQEPRAFTFRIWRAEDPHKVLRRLDPGRFIVNGPWRVLPINPTDSLERFLPVKPGWPGWQENLEQDQPDWRQGHIQNGYSDLYFYSFIVMMPPERRVELDKMYWREYNSKPQTMRKVRYYANRYETRCMKTDILHYILPPTGTAQEHFIADGIVTAFSPEDAIVDDKRIGHDGGTTTPPERMEVRLRAPGIDRVIAQTQHTDHIAFVFEKSETRFSLASIFASLIFCVFSGGKNYDVTISK